MGRTRPRIEFDYYVAPDGATYSFDDAALRYLESFTGDGMPPIEYRTERGPFQDGESVVDWVLRPRVIQMVHRRGARSRSEYWDARADLLNLLRPNRQLTADARQTGRLRKILPNGQTRDLSVLIESGPRFEPRSPDRLDEFGFLETLRFVAWDPTFFDPDLQAHIFAGPMFAHLVFPVALIPPPPATNVDMVFMAANVNVTANLTYLGTWLSYPIIEVTGPAQQAIIENLTTGHLIQLDYDIPAGRVVTIDLAYGRKTVEDDLGVNLIGTLTTDSNLASWHLAPDPVAPLGVNSIHVTYSGANPVSQVEISWYARFIGI